MIFLQSEREVRGRFARCAEGGHSADDCLRKKYITPLWIAGRCHKINTSSSTILDSTRIQEGSIMARAKQASKRRRRKLALPVLGAAGVSLAMGSGASATALQATAPSQDTAPRPMRSLSVKRKFLQTSAWRPFMSSIGKTLEHLKSARTYNLAAGCRGCGCRGCGGCAVRGCRGCGGCGGCRGCGVRGCAGWWIGGCGCGGCNCCWSWGACRNC